MEVTGTKIRGELKLLTTRLSAMSDEFSKSLHYFDNEEKGDPKLVAAEVLILERKTGAWQAAQKEYNTKVTLVFDGRVISLQEAINIVGGFSRVSNLWKMASGASKKGRSRRGDWGGSNVRREVMRSTDSIAAKDSISKKTALIEFERVEKATNELRTKIGVANNTKVELFWLDTALASLS